MAVLSDGEDAKTSIGALLPPTHQYHDGLEASKLSCGKSRPCAQCTKQWAQVGPRRVLAESATYVPLEAEKLADELC